MSPAKGSSIPYGFLSGIHGSRSFPIAAARKPEAAAGPPGSVPRTENTRVRIPVQGLFGLGVSSGTPPKWAVYFEAKPKTGEPPTKDKPG